MSDAICNDQGITHSFLTIGACLVKPINGVAEWRRHIDAGGGLSLSDPSASTEDGSAREIRVGGKKQRPKTTIKVKRVVVIEVDKSN